MSKDLSEAIGMIILIWIIGSSYGGKTASKGGNTGIDKAIGYVLQNFCKCIWLLLRLSASLILSLFSKAGNNNSTKLFDFLSPDPFMSRWEAWFSGFLRKSNTGFRVDAKLRALSKRDSQAHFACIAPSGKGKTAGVIVPNILTETEDSLFIADPNGNIFKNTSQALAQRGYQIVKLSPAQLSGTAFFNPMRRAGTNPSELKKLASLLVASGLENGNQGESFWNHGAENVLTCFLKILANQPRNEFKNFTNLLYLLKTFIATQQEEGGGQVGALARQYLPDEMSLQDFNSLLNLEEKIFGGYMAGALACLDGWNDDGLGKFSSVDTVDLSSFRTGRKMAIYWTVPIGAETRYYRGISAIFFSQLYDVAIKTRGRACKFYLDEIGNFPIPNLSEIITVARNFEIACCLCLQSESQLTSLYGAAKAHTILTGGINSRLYYSGLDLDTTSKLERLTDGALTASEIRQMPFQLLISSDRRPIKLDGEYWFNNPRIKALGKLPPVQIRSGQLPQRVPLIALENNEPEHEITAEELAMARAALRRQQQ